MNPSNTTVFERKIEKAAIRQPSSGHQERAQVEPKAVSVTHL